MLAALAEMRDAAADQRFRQLVAAGDAQTPVVEVGALSPLGDEHVVDGGIVDDTGDDLPLPHQGDRDAEDRDAVEKIGGAVERIDVPGVALVGALDRAALFHHEAVARPRLGQFLEDDLLGLLVGQGDEIAGTLDRNL